MRSEPKDEVSTRCMLNGLVGSSMMPIETCSQDLIQQKRYMLCELNQTII